jgi:hypothetical protein
LLLLSFLFAHLIEKVGSDALDLPAISLSYGTSVPAMPGYSEALGSLYLINCSKAAYRRRVGCASAVWPIFEKSGLAGLRERPPVPLSSMFDAVRKGGLGLYLESKGGTGRG